MEGTRVCEKSARVCEKSAKRLQKSAKVCEKSLKVCVCDAHGFGSCVLHINICAFMPRVQCPVESLPSPTEGVCLINIRQSQTLPQFANLIRPVHVLPIWWDFFWPHWVRARLYLFLKNKKFGYNFYEKIT